MAVDRRRIGTGTNEEKIMNKAVMTHDLHGLKGRLKDTWVAGDFGEIARGYEATAAAFVERLGLEPGTKVLDVACGTGNLAMPAARLGATVAGIDIAPNLIEQAVANAANEGLDIGFETGDCEEMPYRDASFDVVMSMFGAMFAPRPDVVASELARVCRPGGKIAMANWTPEGFIGQMFKTTGKHVPPPAMPSPILWGDEASVRERFAAGISYVRLTSYLAEFVFPFEPEETVEHFRRFYGPTQKAFAALDAGGQTRLRRDLEELWCANNVAEDGTTRVFSEYLEVIAVRRADC